ncbi:hypothetical protein EPN90_04670 [Patescibacteria group bacterium]|nr:MAG: hypothetical protein EPN90_04670 [Patescibacteria group bacterium]
MSRWRRIIGITLFLIIAAVIGFIIYYFFFRPIIAPRPPGVAPPTVGLPPSGVAVPGLPPAAVAPPAPAVPGAPPSPVAAGGLTLAKTLLPSVSRYVQLARDGQSMYYYDQATGQYFKIDPTTGGSVPLSDKTFPEVQNTSWSPAGEAKAIIEFPDNRKIFFDFNKQEQVTLPSHWQEFNWSPKGNEVVTKSIGVSETNRFLVVTNPDGSNARAVESLGRNADKVDLSYSPNGDMIAFSRTGEAQEFGKQEIIPVGKNRENFRSFVVEGFGFESQWTPDGSKILYSVAGERTDWKPALWTIAGRGDGIGGERKFIGLQTWAGKCGMAGPTVAYCAAPRELQTGAGFSRAVANETPDDIYRVELDTGKYRLVAAPTEAAAISKIIVSADGSALYYTELLSGALKQIKLR